MANHAAQMEQFYTEPFMMTHCSKMSGIGTPMLSRAGCETIAHYLCFKSLDVEPISEAPELKRMTEDDKRK